MTPKATRPALQKKAERAKRRNTPGRRPAGVSAGFRPPGVSGASGNTGVTSCSAVRCGSGTRPRMRNRRAMARAPGMASTAKAGHSDPVAAMTAEAIRGPANAPARSSDLWTAKPRPRPTGPATEASRTVFAGLRTALPTRSPMIRADASTSPAAPTTGVTASKGTHRTVSA
ncbi:hypothetical protein D9M72_510840 [compost metagenome]